jgi:hypothetical protein
MNLVPYTNTQPYNQHIGGRVIRPGETRMVDASLLPNATPAEAAPAPEAPNPLAALVKKKVKDIEAALPTLSDAELDEVLKLDGADASDGQPRKGVAEAVAAEKLARAAAKPAEEPQA